jgi:hypothetical protein
MPKLHIELILRGQELNVYNFTGALNITLNSITADLFHQGSKELFL